MSETAGSAPRLDKWLWAARFFKTRTLSQEAIDGGKVRYEGERSKPAKSVAIGARIVLRQGYDEIEVVVQGLSDRRGSATVARTLYQETAESLKRREQLAEQRRIQNASFVSVRPDKRQRRLLDKLKQTLIDAGD